MSPGHQHSEFVPWLLNHSPDCTHGYSFDSEDGREFDRWTEYSSSYGQGWEPKESHWHLDDSITYLYKQSRHQPKFPVDFFEQYTSFLTGTEILYFNIPVSSYIEWVKTCREWFATHHHDVTLLFAGHTMNIYAMKNPSRFFIKEGYIIDKEFVTRENFTIPRDNTVPELKQRRPTDFQPDRTKTKHYNKIQWLRLKDYVKTKHDSRCDNLMKVYNEAGFDIINSINDIINDPTILKYTVRLPKNIDNLIKMYFDKNPPDLELDIVVKELLNFESNNNPYKYKTDFLA